MTKFRRDLGLLETLGLSLSMIAPTMAMSFATTFAVQAAGAVAPLAFLIGTAAMAVVGLSFVAFEKRVAASGSVYAYIGHTFGPVWGFIAGWALLGAYIGFTAAATAVIGNSLVPFLADFGFRGPHVWLIPSLAGALLAFGLTLRDTRIAARLMLLLEAVSVGAILFLALRIFSKVPLSAAPWQPHGSHAWAGIGNGMVFAILAFGGFEGAATLGEETRDPKRAIPLAFMGTVLLSGFLYVIVSYAQILGYGVENVQALGQAESPLSVLSAKFVSRPFAEFIALATAFSAFACTIGSLSAGARMLYTLGRAGTAPWFGVLHPKHRTPARALLLLSAASILGLLTWGFQAGGLAYSGGIVTIGTLALILVYMGVTGAEMVEAFRRNRAFWIVLGFIGTVLLLWPLWNSLYPVPNWPDKLWPYIVVLWLILGALQISRVRKAASITEPVMADQLSGAELGN